MKLFYIDESGTSFRDQSSPFFSLAAFCIDAAERARLDQDLWQLKRGLFNYATKPEDVEIKARDIRRGAGWFKELSWERRLEVLESIARIIAANPCEVFSVILDKHAVRAGIEADEDAYRITFSALLERMEAHLAQTGNSGLIMVDARSDMHSSVQDRRLIDAYRVWAAGRNPRFPELPWFGFSAFYSGLQLADYCAYMIDFEHNEITLPSRVEREIRRIRSSTRQEDLVNKLQSGDLNGARDILHTLECIGLRRLVNQSKALDIARILTVGADSDSAYHQLTCENRNSRVAAIVKSFQHKLRRTLVP